MDANEDEPVAPSAHDLIGLGEIEAALSRSLGADQVQRLPFLLRILALAQPLSSVPAISGVSTEHRGLDVGVGVGVGGTCDQLIDSVVSCLEDVAAVYPAAEGVDVLTTRLAPSVCRKISKLKPLRRLPRRDIIGVKRRREDIYDTSQLASIVTGEHDAKKRLASAEETVPDEGLHDSGDELEEEGENVEMSDFTQDQTPDHALYGSDKNVEKKDATSTRIDERLPVKQRKRKHAGGSIFARAALAEDSREAMVAKTLSEITSLVLASLQPTTTGATIDEDGATAPEQAFPPPSVDDTALSVKTDSLLSEPATNESNFIHRLGGTAGTNLRSTIAALLYHAPVLRLRHVASALCRASVPQTAEIISNLAANCPTSSTCLVRGCVNAFHAGSAIEKTRPTHACRIKKTASAAVRAICKLSKCEACRAVSILSQAHVMQDVALEFLLQYDSCSASMFLIEHLSSNIYIEPPRKLKSETCDNRRNILEPQIDSTAKIKPHRRRIRGKPSSNTTSPFSIKLLLVNNEQLAGQIYESLTQSISLLVTDGDILSIGQATMHIRAFGLTCFYLRGGEGYSETNTDALIQKCIKEIGRIVKKIQSDKMDSDSKSTRNDQYLQVVLCACISACTRLESIGNRHNDSSYDRETEECEWIIRSLVNSTKIDLVRFRVGSLLMANKGAELRSCVRRVLTGMEFEMGDDNSADVERFSNVCIWASSIMGIEPEVSPDAASLLQPGALENIILAAKEGTLDKSQLKSYTEEILQDANLCAKVVKLQGASLLLEESVSFLKEEVGCLPIISPLQVEVLARKAFKVSSASIEDNELSNTRFQFIFSLLYSLLYMDAAKKSPFAVDLSVLPIEEALSFLQKRSSCDAEGGRLERISNQIQELLSKKYWEVLEHQLLSYDLDNSHSMTATRLFGEDDTVEMMTRAIRMCVNGAQSNDPAGLRAERLFLRALDSSPSSTVVMSVVRAVLQASPPQHVTFNGICQDPLVLLKLPLSTWRRDGIRRILLFVLGRILPRNERMAGRVCKSENVLSQMIGTRNGLIVRALLVLVSGEQLDGKQTLPSMCCPLISNLIRQLMTVDGSMLAFVVRQGISGIALDWLIESVPELFEGCEYLLLLLGEKNALSPVERLAVSDAALRLAIVHGSKDDKRAQELVYKSLTVLLSSFFVIMGPTGMPVSAVHDEEGLDVTESSRKLMFRMLDAMGRIRGNRLELRTEAAIALQKLAALCKGDGNLSGLVGIAAARRKQLLKETFDACQKAITSIGNVQ